MITVVALFTKNNGQPATGLTLSEIALYLYRRAKSGGAVTTLWNGEHPTEEIGGGLYSRAYTGEDEATYGYYGHAYHSGATSLDCDYAVNGYRQDTSVQAGSTITIHRGDALSTSIANLGSLAGRTRLWFTVKGDKNDSDSESVVQIEETAGLVTLNGAAGTAAQGDITVTDEVLGNITITMEEAATRLLPPDTGYHYDVQVLTSSGTDTLAYGTANVDADVTRAVT